jgi:hypothetical protein
MSSYQASTAQGHANRRARKPTILWQLTKDVTALAVRPGSPSEVSEAAAALQHLMSQAAPPDGPDRWTARLAELSGLCPGGADDPSAGRRPLSGYRRRQDQELVGGRGGDPTAHGALPLRWVGDQTAV